MCYSMHLPPVVLEEVMTIRLVLVLLSWGVPAQDMVWHAFQLVAMVTTHNASSVAKGTICTY